MARDLRVKARLEADTRDAERNIGRTRGVFAGLAGFLRDRFVITLGDVTRILGRAVDAIGGFVAAAEEQQDVVNRLDAALRKLGPAATEVSAALQAQAAELERTTRFGDEAIIAQQALVANLGLTADQIKLVTSAAADLAAGTGRSLEFAFINLARTFGGTAGELSELIPALRDLTEAELRAGEGARVIAEQFSGAAAADAKTFSGIIAQLGNSFGSLQEQIGRAIVENDEIVGSLGELRRVITSPEFIDGVESLAQGLSDIASSTVKAVAELPKLVRQISDFDRGLRETAGPFEGLIERLRTFRVNEAPLAAAASEKITDAIARWTKSITEVGRAQRESAEATREGTDAQEDATDATNERVDAETRLERILRESKEAQDELNDALSDAGVSVTVASEEIEKLEDALQQADQAYRQGIIDGDRYRATVEAITEKMQEFAPTAADAAAGVDSLGEGFGRARGNADEFGQEVDRLRGRLDSTTESASRLNAETGGALSGIRARDRRSQADVEAALAAGRRPTLGGTRIRTADGSGSRLV